MTATEFSKNKEHKKDTMNFVIYKRKHRLASNNITYFPTTKLSKLIVMLLKIIASI